MREDNGPRKNRKQSKGTQMERNRGISTSSRLNTYTQPSESASGLWDSSDNVFITF